MNIMAHCHVTLRHSKLEDFRLRRRVNKIFALLGTYRIQL